MRLEDYGVDGTGSLVMYILSGCLLGISALHGFC